MGIYDDNQFSELIGLHLTTVGGLAPGSDEVVFLGDDGSRWVMWHSQDCCEGVSVYDVIGDVADLQDATVIDAREEVSQENPHGIQPEYQDSFTWTFYIIQTNKGAVTIRWYGESNGYYSESVSFRKEAAHV